MRYAGKRDGNHDELRTTWRAVGCSVLDLGNVGGGAPDMLVATRKRPPCPSCGATSRTFLAEVKDGTLPPSARALRAAQVKFHASWNGELWVVETREQALRLVGL